MSEPQRQQTHDAFLEVNLEALKHNFSIYRSFLNDGVKVMAMVKSYSYGTGLKEIADAFLKAGTDYFSVAYIDEGIALRNSGIKTPIMVIAPEVAGFDLLEQYKLEPTVYSLEMLEKLKVCIKDSINVHIEFDTGMHRLGFFPGQVHDLVEVLESSPQIKVASIYTHLAASNLSSEDDFTDAQVNKLVHAAQPICEKFGNNILLHAANTGGISRHPSAQLDMVRPGIGLYGAAQSPKIQSQLIPVASFKTKVLQVKQLAARQSVGYGRAGKAAEKTQIAVIATGYGDGIDRKLGEQGKGRVYFEPIKAYGTIIGRVCMDMIMVDIGDLTVKAGDQVELFGAHIPLEEVAEKCDTIPYEILTNISSRVERVYV